MFPVSCQTRQKIHCSFFNSFFFKSAITKITHSLIAPSYTVRLVRALSQLYGQSGGQPLVDRLGKFTTQAEKVAKIEGSIYTLRQSINTLFWFPFLGHVFYTFDRSSIHLIEFFNYHSSPIHHQFI